MSNLRSHKFVERLVRHIEPPRLPDFAFHPPPYFKEKYHECT